MITSKRMIPMILLTVLLGGCMEKVSNEQNVTRTVITGNVKHREVYPNTNEITVNIIDFRSKKTSFSDSIQANGSFAIEFDLYTTQDIEVNPLVGKIIASPGDSIHIEIDFKDIGNIHFSGDRQKSNTDLNYYLNRNYGYFSFNNRKNKSMDLRSYKSFCDSVKTTTEQNRQEFIREINPTSEIIQWTRDYIDINYQRSLIMFPFMYAYKKRINYQDLNIPGGYYSFIDSIEQNFSDSMINTNIYELLDAYTALFAQKMPKDTTISRKQYYPKLLKELIAKHEQGYLKQMLIGNLFYKQLNQNNLEFYADNKILLEKNISETAISIPLNNYYNKLVEQLKNPEINSNATLSRLNGSAGKSLIDSIWAKNQGKVIYIDFWATWCGPCKAEMPNSKKLKQKLAQKNVEFVYLCIDSEEEQWRLTLSQLQLDGQHFLCNKEQSISIRQAFDIHGIPYYMLVNKNGHIVEAGNHLRPMHSETIEKIEKLLHEE